MPDRIRHLKLSHVVLPLDNPDQRRQGAHRPAEADDRGRASCSSRSAPRTATRGSGSATPSAPAAPRSSRTPRRSPPSLIGEDPSDIGKHLDQAAAGPARRSAAAGWPPRPSPRSTSRCGTSRPSAPACRWPSCSAPTATRCQTYNTSGGFLHASIEQVMEKATASLESGIGGIKIKVGQPDWQTDLERVTAVREHLGDDVPLMVDANQQWDRRHARMRMGRELEQFDLVWIEEPLDAYDAEGHADLGRALDTPIATGEMLASVAEHMRADRRRLPRTSSSPTPRGSAASPRSCSSPRWPTHATCSSRRTSRWRSTCTWPRRTRPSRGSSTSTGSTRCSTSASRSATAGCGSRPPRPRLHPQRPYAGPHQGERHDRHALMCRR